MKKVFLLLSSLVTGLGASLAIAPQNTLVIQWASAITTTDPHHALDSNIQYSLTNVYETLVTYERNTSKLVPMLATSWKVGNNNKTFTFALRKNVKFHSGSDFTCKDAEYSLRRLLISSSSLTYAFYLSLPLLGFDFWDDDLKKTTKFSSLTKAVHCDTGGNLVLETPQPSPLLLQRLTGTYAAILDSKFAIANGEWDGTQTTWKDWIAKDLSNSAFNKPASGTGAYQMVSRESEQLVFKAFSGYWGEKPKLENVIFKSVSEDASRVLAIKNGDADFIFLGNRASLAQVRGAAGVKVLVGKSPDSSAIMMNQDIAPKSKFIGSGKLDGKGIPTNFFSDIHVRRGLAASFDHNRMIKEIYSGNGERRVMAIPSLLPDYDPSIKIQGFDPELAKREFKQAFNGEVWNKGFSFLIPLDADRDMYSLLKQGLEKLNPKFKVLLKDMPQADLYAALGQNVVPITINGTNAEIPDGEALARFFYSSSGTFAPHTHYNDPQTEKAFAQLATTADPAARAKLMGLIGRRAAELLPIIPLPGTDRFWIYRQELKGFEANINTFRYTYLLWNSISK